MRFLFTILFSFFVQNAFAQVTGGESVYQFLRLPSSARSTGMGGLCVSNPSQDLALSFSNPALLRPLFANQLAINQNFYTAGSSFTTAMYAGLHAKSNTMFAGGITLMDHGRMVYTNAQGQSGATLLAKELCIQASASRLYKTKWRYGASLKFVNSQLGDVQSAGLMADAGLVYFDTSKQIYVGMLVKNIGFQLNKYNANGSQEPLPFDMQIGISKKFIKAPFRLNAIIHHLYQWNIQYDNPADRTNTSFFGNEDTLVKTNYVDQAFRHFNFGVDLVLGKKIEVNIGYSHQRRQELALKEKLGFAGFSFGVGLNLPKMQINYGRNVYNLAGNYNVLGINFKMNELFGIGKKGNTAGWY
jgi:hypothetical protein